MGLVDYVSELKNRQLTSESERFASSHLEHAGLLVDWSRQLVDKVVLNKLNNLAKVSDVHGYLKSIDVGECVNLTEQRSALHTWIRDLTTERQSAEAVEIQEQRSRMLEFTQAVRSGNHVGYTDKPFTDILHIGIGGSHLGPELVCQALDENHQPRIHFLTNAHQPTRARLLRGLNPETTLVVVASKSYRTAETIANSRHIRSWCLERTPSDCDLTNHFVHITSNRNADTGAETVFYLPESIGGRYSVMSVMGLPVAIALGKEQYMKLLEGAHTMDQHVLATVSPSKNLAIRLALLGIWNTNVLNASAHLVLPYDPRLQLLPTYLQQLEMESNGKSITNDGEEVRQNTVSFVLGGNETDGQHAFHQCLHQGTHNYSADFIVTLDADSFDSNSHTLANALAQSSVMLNGHRAEEGKTYTAISGNHGSTVLVLKQLNAYTLGALIALYEHKVACMAHLWNINPFDQWGVEAGKRITTQVESHLLTGTNDGVDSATQDILSYIKNWSISTEK